MIYIIGTGLEGNNTLTVEAKNYIQAADVLIGAGRMINSVKHLLGEGEKELVEEYKSDEIVEYIKKHSDKNIAVLMSGDIGFFSGSSKLRQKLADIYDVKVVSGISSFVYFCNRINVTWNDVNVVSLHGLEANIAREVATHHKTFFLLGGEYSAAKVCDRLCEYSLAHTDVYIGERLGMEGEKIHTGKAGNMLALETDNLCVMLVVNENYERFVMTGIDDEEFVRSEVPMTKSCVRAVVMSKLRVESGSVCVDIGCGTGSVSVEMAKQAVKGKVYGIDKNSDAIHLTRENAKKFSCDNIIVVHKDIKAGLLDMPSPDVVFVGGSSGSLDKVFEYVVSKNHNCRVVITAISLETLSAAISEFKKYDREYFVTEISVATTRKIGSHTLLNGENPIFIIGDR